MNWAAWIKLLTSSHEVGLPTELMVSNFFGSEETPSLENTLPNQVTWFLQKLLFQPTLILCGSAFPEDQGLGYLLHVVGKIKLCLEAGRPLLLVGLRFVKTLCSEAREWKLREVVSTRHGVRTV